MTATPDLLIVDDDPANHGIADVISAATGWRTARADIGAPALEAARGHRHALILIDIRRPATDGFGTAAAIRAGGGISAATPILVIAAARRLVPAARLRASGIDGRIVSPFDADTLRSAIEPWRPPDTPAPIAKLAALFGAAEIGALLAGFRHQLDEALGSTDTPRYAGAHRLAGIAGTLGFPDVSKWWLAVSEGDETASAKARISARKALAEIAMSHI